MSKKYNHHHSKLLISPTAKQAARVAAPPKPAPIRRHISKYNIFRTPVCLVMDTVAPYLMGMRGGVKFYEDMNVI